MNINQLLCAGESSSYFPRWLHSWAAFRGIMMKQNCRTDMVMNVVHRKLKTMSQVGLHRTGEVTSKEKWEASRSHSLKKWKINMRLAMLVLWLAATNKCELDGDRLLDQYSIDSYLSHCYDCELIESSKALLIMKINMLLGPQLIVECMESFGNIKSVWLTEGPGRPGKPLSPRCPGRPTIPRWPAKPCGPRGPRGPWDKTKETVNTIF